MLPPGVLAGVILWSGLRAMGLRTEKNRPSNTFSASSAAVVVTLFHPFASSRVSSSKFLSTFST